MATIKTSRQTPEPEALSTEAEAPFPQPTSNPPGGGSWRWNTTTGKWVENNQPTQTEQE